MRTRDLLYKRKLTDLIHVLFCTLEHSDNPGDLLQGVDIPEDTCLYNVENTLLDPWSRRDHARWLLVSEAFLDSTTLGSYEDAFLLWVELLDRHRQVEDILIQEPALREWFLRMV